MYSESAPEAPRGAPIIAITRAVPDIPDDVLQDRILDLVMLLLAQTDRLIAHGELPAVLSLLMPSARAYWESTGRAALKQANKSNLAEIRLMIDQFYLALTGDDEQWERLKSAIEHYA